MIRAGLFLLATFVSSAALAHHAFSAFYDTDNVGAIEGEIVETFLINPHAGYRIRTDDGEIWNIETAPINRLQRLGLADAVAVGDRVTFRGAFSRLGRNEVLATNMTMPNGQEVLLDPGFANRLGLADRVSRGGGGGEPVAADSGDEPEGIYRVWSRARGANDQDPERTFTAAALAARDAWDPVVDDPALRCIAPGMPVAMDTPFPFAFEEGNGRILIRIEQWDGRRSIHMDGDLNPQAQPPSLMGYSVGRWEGRTLVVETSHISWPYVDEFGTPKSDEFTMTERFIFSEDSRQMTWEATSNDPTTYEGSAFLGRAGYEWVPGEEIKPYDCSLGAAGG
jgi:hypothetical protein